jgi:hypothetical protein
LADQDVNLLKIDVEGFESDVLKGASTVLQRQSLKAIIIELNGSGKKYGFDESLIHGKLLKLGFRPFSYRPFLRELTAIPTWGKSNTIYIRDVNFVSERLRSAESFKIFGKLI